jgi:hypothetical protein
MSQNVALQKRVEELNLQICLKNEEIKRIGRPEHLVSDLNRFFNILQNYDCP